MPMQKEKIMADSHILNGNVMGGGKLTLGLVNLSLNGFSSVF